MNKVIGLTGRVGSGKSRAAAAICAHFLVKHIDLDILGHEQLHHPDVMNRLTNYFGKEILDENGAIYRPALGNLVFSSSDGLLYLNSVIHPKLLETVQKALLDGLDGVPVLISGALLVEIGILPLCTNVIIIDADDEAIRRVIPDKFDKISPHQLSREAYLKLGTSIITNTFTGDFEAACIQTFKSLV
jgi:dephospho-CoA kinase